ncbi:hypothetical protein [Sphingobium sp. YR768]|uniref:hypothetical protein n=1 Tax=Sphingobium sp. YR768 TaxID=1884365 RepID=UPI00115FBF8B|nr:hypothetical protein [Sphingobium sp. YR768]
MAYAALQPCVAGMLNIQAQYSTKFRVRAGLFAANNEFLDIISYSKQISNNNCHIHYVIIFIPAHISFILTQRRPHLILCCCSILPRGKMPPIRWHVRNNAQA